MDARILIVDGTGTELPPEVVEFFARSEFIGIDYARDAYPEQPHKEIAMPTHGFPDRYIPPSQRMPNWAARRAHLMQGRGRK